MDLLKLELERKKKALQEAKKKKGDVRYVKASDLRRLQEEEDNRKRPLDDEQEDSLLKKQRRTSSDEETNETSSGDEAVSTTKRRENKNETSQVLLCDTEITRRFRQMGLPIRLFGETEDRRMSRLNLAEKEYAATALHRTEQDEFRLKMGHGIRNPFLEKEQRQQTAAMVPSQAVDGNRDKKELQQAETKDKDTKDDDKGDPHKRVYRFFKDLLKQWEADLNARSDADKSTVAGRNETKTLKQCKDYIRPLFRLCKRRQVESNMLNKLNDIVTHCSDGEFVKAHDAYMDVAIGRAAWPIGVTMVGIHARTGRSKIESSNVAHVMNSELQRKYLTSVKRLITYNQSQRTDVDPSKKVVNK